VTKTFGLSADLSFSATIAALVVGALALLLLGVELRRHRADGSLLVALSGMIASALAMCALLRPVSIATRGSLVGPRVAVLVDRSRSVLLPDAGQPRERREAEALATLAKSASGARIALHSFGEGPPLPFESVEANPARGMRSDLATALHDVLARSDETPGAVVVISDGRLDTPAAASLEREMAQAEDGRSVPVHTVSIAERDPKDASIRVVRAAGAAVAHQPMSLTVEVGCAGGLSCDTLPVTVRELLDGAPPALLASGMAKLENGVATLDLTVTLDRAGPRLVEVAIESPSGDEIPDNDRRFLAFDVARERVRVLHVAGRPTYDVRALRTWLKSNASVDVVAFFILRTENSNVVASDNELALIRFPVDELFTEHLASFDAVILQDFNAVPYKLLRYLPNLAKYVQGGGGFVMVGGPDAFLGGGYAGTDLEKVLPVDLPKQTDGAAFDLGGVVPRHTLAGRSASMLAPLHALFGDELPTMPGYDIVGDAKPGALTLWEHPTRKTASGKPMPLLTLGEFGDGRSIALPLDGAHRLGFSEFAARVAGRGHGALWDGLLGWLMRDPRFEPAQVELAHACIAGEPMALRVTPLAGTTGNISVEVTSASERMPPKTSQIEIPATGGAIEVPIGTFPAGGYMAKIRVGSGAATRRAFPCERGGDEWADSRPDEDRLRAIAKATRGKFVRASDIGSVTFPAATMVSAERTVSPILPPWAWTLCAAAAMGAHWIARRRAGLA
jgi:uncharacterized membrane protein